MNTNTVRYVAMLSPQLRDQLDIEAEHAAETQAHITRRALRLYFHLVQATREGKRVLLVDDDANKVTDLWLLP